MRITKINIDIKRADFLQILFPADPFQWQFGRLDTSALLSNIIIVV